MSDFIAVDTRGIPELQAKLAQLPDAAADAGVEEANRYILNVMREYAPYQHVTRFSAYNKTFFTEKQRKYFFWALNHGVIITPYHRTQHLRKEWKLIGAGRNQMVANEVEYAGLVMGDGMQERLHRKMGWDTEAERIRDRIGRIVEKFDAGVKKAIRRLGL